MTWAEWFSLGFIAGTATSGAMALVFFRAAWVTIKKRHREAGNDLLAVEDCYCDDALFAGERCSYCEARRTLGLEPPPR